MKRILVVLTLASVMAVTVGAWPGGATPVPTKIEPTKIEPPPVTLPALPAPAQQALGLVAPLVDGQCGSAITALALLVPAFAGSLPIDPVPLLAGVVQLCGEIPQSGVPAVHCGVDTDVTNALSMVLGSLKILLAIVDTQVAAPLDEELGVLTMPVPASLGLEAVTSAIAGALGCTVVTKPGSGKAAPLGSTPPPPATLPGATTPPPATGPSTSSPPLYAAPAPVSVTPPAIAAPSSAGGNLTPAAGPLPPRQLVAVSAPGGSTPAGSALVGLALVIILALGIAVGLHRQATPGP